MRASPFFHADSSSSTRACETFWFSFSLMARSYARKEAWVSAFCASSSASVSRSSSCTNT